MRGVSCALYTVLTAYVEGEPVNTFRILPPRNTVLHKIPAFPRHTAHSEVRARVCTTQPALSLVSLLRTVRAFSYFFVRLLCHTARKCTAGRPCMCVHTERSFESIEYRWELLKLAITVIVSVRYAYAVLPHEHSHRFCFFFFRALLCAHVCTCRAALAIRCGLSRFFTLCRFSSFVTVLTHFCT